MEIFENIAQEKDLTAEMDWEGVSARRVLVLSFFESDSSWSRFLCESKEIH